MVERSVQDRPRRENLKEIAMNPIGRWIAALASDVLAKLERGALVADVACGAGASTLVLAKAYPRSRFRGFDASAAAIEQARRQAVAAGVADRLTFEIAGAADYPGSGYDLVACFGCLSQVSDPIAAARHTRKSIAADGVWMIVEPLTAGGAQRLRALATQGGFTRFRRATTAAPFTLVLEARG
jgi:2-polyprenyl-3-methyl-5-hydroxy-6-metoxy-1,4-benzoquinol methylase